MPQITTRFKSELDENDKILYTRLFQVFGRNIRLWVMHIIELIPNKVYTLSELSICDKDTKKENIANQEGVRVVIDA